MSNQPVESILLNSKLSSDLKSIAEKVYTNQRITFEEGVILYNKAELGYLGVLANYIREQKNGNNVYFNRNFHIEPTNICVFDCKFCSYSRLLKNKEEGWELSEEQIIDIVKKIRWTTSYRSSYCWWCAS